MADETITNERGARQSKIGVKFTDFDPAALLRVGRVSAEGFAKYGKGNWQQIDQADHIDHAINHLLEYQAGNMSEDHLAHAVCRVLFAMGTEPKVKEECEELRMCDGCRYDDILHPCNRVCVGGSRRASKEDAE